MSSTTPETGGFNDRLGGEESGTYAGKLPIPEVSIIVDGNRIFKPGMKTVFVEDDQEVAIRSAPPDDVSVVGGEYCTCNTVTVCTCNAVCTCQAVCTCESVCSCVGHCSCNQVCTCESVCSCVGHCSCNQVCSCENVCSCNNYASGRGVPCTGPCACVPVH